MWNNWKAHIVLVGTLNGTIALENPFRQFLVKLKHKLTMWSGSSTHKNLSKRNKNIVLPTDLSRMFAATSSILAKNWNQLYCPSILIVVCPYDGMLVGNKRKLAIDVINSVDEPQKPYSERCPGGSISWTSAFCLDHDPGRGMESQVCLLGQCVEPTSPSPSACCSPFVLSLSNQ